MCTEYTNSTLYRPFFSAEPPSYGAHGASHGGRGIHETRHGARRSRRMRRRRPQLRRRRKLHDGREAADRQPRGQRSGGAGPRQGASGRRIGLGRGQQEDEGEGQDQDGVHRQQVEALHDLLKAEDGHHEKSKSKSGRKGSKLFPESSSSVHFHIFQILTKVVMWN